MMIKKERIIKEFIELVSVPCPSRDEKKEAELLMEKLRGLGLSPEMDSLGEKIGGTCGNVWAFVKGNAEAPALFFEAHMDSVDPTTGTKVVRKDGIMYSDGTTTLGGDDKAGVAAILEAVRAVKEDNIPHGDIQICFTVCEEDGCLGARKLDPARIKADIGYCMDTDGDPGEITYAAPRQYYFNFTVTGKAAHSGINPEEGINAVMLAAKALTALPKYGRIDEETTLNVGLLSGGVAFNVVAPEAKCTIDMRSLDPDKVDRLRDETFRILKEAVEKGGGRFDAEINEGCPPVAIGKDHPCITLAEKAAERLGFKSLLKTSCGCSDGNFLNGHGLPCAVLATGMSNIHTTGEYLKEEDLFNTARWVYEIIKLAAER